MTLEFGTQLGKNPFPIRGGNDAEFNQVAVGFEDRLILRCKAAPEIHESLETDLLVFIQPHEGKVSEGRILDADAKQDREHEIEGEYVAWKQILKGEIDVKRAVIIKRTLIINGKVTKLLKHLKAVERIIKVLNEMVEEGVFAFPDENIQGTN